MYHHLLSTHNLSRQTGHNLPHRAMMMTLYSSSTTTMYLLSRHGIQTTDRSKGRRRLRTTELELIMNKKRQGVHKRQLWSRTSLCRQPCKGHVKDGDHLVSNGY